jgi:nitrite reductase (NADH) large subunit
MRVVVVGAGPAGARCAELLGARGIATTLIGAEAGLPYNRVALSQFLADDIDETALVTHSQSRMAELGIAHFPGMRVVAIERGARAVVAEDGQRIGYDALVLALGAAPVRLPLPGADLAHVLMYRTLADVRAMIDGAAAGGDAVVIGGGLLGIEAAAGLARRGMRVSVLHAVGRLMERQLDDAAGALLTRRLARQGIAVELTAATRAITPAGVVLGNGRVLPARIVVMAVGIRPEVALARESGLEVGRGIVVDDAMRTRDAAVFAIGECAEHRGLCCGLAAPALAQAATAAAAIAGEAARYVPAIDATALKVAGAPVWSAGEHDAADAEAIVFDDAPGEEYRKLLLRDGRLVGAVLYGETADAPWYLDLIAGGRPLGALRAILPLGRAFAPEAAA